MRLIAIFYFALLLVACGDPHDTKVPTDISKWSSSVKPSLQKLTPEERVLFSQFVIRHLSAAADASNASPIPEDMTIGKAIEEQRNYMAQQQAKESGQSKGDSAK